MHTQSNLKELFIKLRVTHKPVQEWLTTDKYCFYLNHTGNFILPL